MLSDRLRRSFPVIILLAGLVLPLTPASAFSFPSAPIRQSAMGSSVWAWLAHLFQAAWEKNGMTIDPNGQPAATAPPVPQVPMSMPDSRG